MNYFVVDDNRAFCGYRRGLVPRDLEACPVASSSMASSFSESFQLIPREEWPERIKDMERTKSRVSDLINFRPLDQNGQGFCWAYSTVACLMALRAIAGADPVRLSPHAVACQIYNFRDRGAWGAVSFDFVAKYGCPSEAYWPQQSMSRTHLTDGMRKDAEQYRILEGFIDLDVAHPADADLTFDQVCSLNLSCIPTVDDYMWWGHSVMGCDVVDTKPNLGQQGLDDPNRFARLIFNSWGDWGDGGFGLLRGSKARPDGGCAPRSSTI